jgi:hypothetical protein
MTNEEHIDPEERIKLLQDELALKELLAEAFAEAVGHRFDSYRIRHLCLCSSVG